MTKKINQKVINMFDRLNNQEPIEDDLKVVDFEDEIYCICLTKDDNGKFFDKSVVLNSAMKVYYIVRLIVDSEPHPVLYNYQVPAEKLIEFICRLNSGEIHGKLVEIEKYYPKDLA